MTMNTHHENRANHSKRIHLAIALLILQLICFPVASISAATPDDEEENSMGNISAKGCFTCDFGLPSNFPLGQVAAVIERDRMYMAERRGMQRKQLPMRVDGQTGNLFSGGRYLFDTKSDAVRYKDWVENDFILDGTLFLDRPYFLSPECHAWQVIGAQNLKELNQQVIMRTERWRVPPANQKEALKQKWSQLLTAATQKGLAGVWLTYNKEEQLAQIVYFADRIVPPDPYVPDFVSLGALESAAPLGAIFNNQSGWTKTFDRTQWVLTVWFPFVLGDQGQPSLWPNSPPLPEPYAGDGVCEVSRGENFTNAPSDCAPTSGNGVCDPGENSQNTPGDCRLP
ncbi:MAG TPA: hypothetical protein VMS31_13690 [Pyrinomonadaceae bacterium]|nr:hypothetical protein [Pyrinomonadaceae bacterium]